MAFCVETIPVDCLGFALEGLTGQRDKTEGGNRRNGLTGFLGDFTIEFSLGHGFFLVIQNVMTAHTLPVKGAANDERKPTEMPTTRGLAVRSVDLHEDEFFGRCPQGLWEARGSV